MPYVPLLKTAIINIPKELTKPININIPKELSEILIKFINNGFKVFNSFFLNISNDVNNYFQIVYIYL